MLQMLPGSRPRGKSGLPEIINRGKELIAAVPHVISCAMPFDTESTDSNSRDYRLGRAEGYSRGLKTGLRIGVTITISTWIITTYAPPLVETYRTVGDGLKAGANGWAACFALVVMSGLILVATGVGLVCYVRSRSR